MGSNLYNSIFEKYFKPYCYLCSPYAFYITIRYYKQRDGNKGRTSHLFKIPVGVRIDQILPTRKWAAILWKKLFSFQCFLDFGIMGEGLWTCAKCKNCVYLFLHLYSISLRNWVLMSEYISFNMVALCSCCKRRQNFLIWTRNLN